MTVHEIDNIEYVTRTDYQAVVERAQALDNELALVRLELHLEQQPVAKVVPLGEACGVVVDFVAERARRRP